MIESAPPPAVPEGYGIARPDWQQGWLQGVRPALAVLLAGLAWTFVLTILVRQMEERGARSRFQAATAQRFALLDGSLQRVSGQLDAIGTFFDLSPQVRRQQFRQLVQASLQTQSPFAAIEWVPCVNINSVPTLRREMQQEGLADFEVHEHGPQGSERPVSPRAEYFPVVYIEPLKGNEHAIGLDLGSDTMRMRALLAARSQGRTVATMRAGPIQGRREEDGILLFRPVFRQTLLPAGSLGESVTPGLEGTQAGLSVGVAADRADLRGFVVGVLAVERLLADDTGTGRLSGIGLHVLDESAPSDRQGLFPAEAVSQSAADLLAAGAVVHRVSVGGRNWAVFALPADMQFRANRTASWVVLLAGLLLTGLLARLQQAIVGRKLSVARQVAQATAALYEEQRRLLASNQRLVLSTQHKTVFLASMSHEFRTPMNAVLGLLHVLERTRLDDMQRDYLAKIGSAGRRLLKLIDDILDVSRAEAGKLVAERYPFALEQVLQDVLVAVAPRVHDKPVELLVDLDPGLPAQLLGDPSRLTQILINLADNAAKFTRSGEIEIRIQVHARAAHGMDIQFAISDSGPGLSAAEAVRVFQPFVQVRHPPDLSSQGGAGLGLAICRQLVNLLGGDIQVTSTPGEGSCFSFVLPFGVEDARPMLDWRADGHKVLILDPHPAAGQTLLRLLRAAGATACHAAHADSALAWLQSPQADAVLQCEEFPHSALLASVLASQSIPVRSVLTRFGGGLTGEPVHPANEKPILPSALAVLLGIEAAPYPADD